MPPTLTCGTAPRVSPARIRVGGQGRRDEAVLLPSPLPRTKGETRSAWGRQSRPTFSRVHCAPASLPSAGGRQAARHSAPSSRAATPAIRSLRLAECRGCKERAGAVPAEVEAEEGRTQARREARRERGREGGGCRRSGAGCWSRSAGSLRGSPRSLRAELAPGSTSAVPRAACRPPAPSPLPPPPAAGPRRRRRHS